MARRVFVAGGSNIDIIGKPNMPLRLHDSNVGAVNIAPGGVGRNMAENLARMGFDVQLFTAVGADLLRLPLIESCKKLRIGLDYAYFSEDAASSVYLCVNDFGGNMHVALNDMAVCDLLASDLVPFDALSGFDACVIDANIPAQTAAFIAKNSPVPVFADTVSVHKALNLLSALEHLFCIKPNCMEAEALTGESDPGKAASALVKMGIEWACVTDGANGVYWATREDEGVEATDALSEDEISNTTGCGDSFTATLCAAYLHGLTLQQAINMASRVARLTLTSSSAVSERLDGHIFD